MVEGNIGTLVLSVVGAEGPPTGWYCDPVKMIVIAIVIVPWLLVVPWVQKDARRVLAPHMIWSGAVLGAGALSVLVWMLIPIYAIGLLIYVVVTGAVLMAYVAYRDARVAEEHKILTKSFLASVLQSGKPKKVDVQTRIKFYASDGAPVIPPDTETADPSDCETYNRVQELLYDIIWRRASEADLTPGGEQTRVRYVIDGVATNRPSLGPSEADSLIQYLKPVAGMDPADRRRPQEGKISVDLASKPIDIMLTTAGTTGGQRMQFRIIQESIRTRLEDLGMSEDVLKRVQEINKTGKGMIIASGRPGAGVTSTLYSLLRAHDAFIKQLLTLESTTEVDLENITQQEYKDPAKLAGALTSLLRRDPDVVMVDRCPDTKAAEVISSAAAEKTVLLGMHASDTFVAMARWVRVCANPVAAMEHLSAVLCQVLLRGLCPNCREAYTPDPQVLAKANLAAQTIGKFFRPPTTPLTDEKGHPIICPACQGSGYLGRTAAFELLEVTDEVRDAVARRAPLTEIKATCRKNKMMYLQEQALRKVIEGETSVQEILRVSQPAKKK